MRRNTDLAALRAPLSRDVNRAYGILVWGVFLLSFFKGFRLPNTWAATHFAFNYSQGFMRRALVGELARRIGGDDVYTYRLFTLLSLSLMAGVLLLFALAARRALEAWSGDWALRIALLVLCASPGLVFLVHLIGYFDYFGLLAVLGLLNWLKKPRHPPLVFLVIASGGALLSLIHEGLLVMFSPTALFLAILNWLRRNEQRPLTARDWLWLVGQCLVSGFFLAACVVAVTRASGTEHSRALQAFATRHADFAIRSDAFDVLVTPLRKNVLEVVPGFWKLEREQQRASQGMLGFVPGFAFILYCGWRELRAREPGLPLRFPLVLGFLGAALAPELMNIAGWDWPRWNSMALMNSVICMLAYATFFPRAARPRPALGLLTSGLLLSAIGLASTTILFDNLEVQFFPFEHQGQLIERAFQGRLGHGNRQ